MNALSKIAALAASALIVTTVNIAVATSASAADTPPAGCCELGGESQSDSGNGSDSADRLSDAMVRAQSITNVTDAATTDTTGASTSASCPTCAPAVYYNPSVAAGTIFYEGQGNIDPTTGRPKYYTCGPASARNVIYFMAHHDYGEAYFESLLHTTRSGTVVKDMDYYLNRTFTQYDWVDYQPNSASATLAVVISDTWRSGYLPMQGLNTSGLPGFAGRSLGHIDFDYGYNGGQIYMGEEWNPVKAFGSSSYNPYGKKLVAATIVYTAIHAGLSKSMVM